MKILTRYTAILLAAFVLIQCGDREGVSVVGKVDNPIDGSYISLLKITDLGMEAIDSVMADAQGNFELIVPVNGTEFYRLGFYGRQYANLILSDTDQQVEVAADGTNPRGKLSISGSAQTRRMQAFDSLAFKRQSDIQLLTREANQARTTGNLQVIQDINEQYYYLNGRHNENLKEMIRQSVPQLVGLYGINYINIEEDFEFADSLATIYNQNLPENPLTKDFVSRVQTLRSLAVGAPAPEISLPTPEGPEITLSSLKGNYVLIDFWAAWCKPCRMENPNVVRLYNKYRGENFEIFGVSLDRKRDAWLKAISDDGLMWKHVSDLKYFNSEAAREYNITAIPATYLIDPDGNIMAKGLRGPTLQRKLEEIFGS